MYCAVEDVSALVIGVLKFIMKACAVEDQGRLDYGGEGLVLLTNNGALARTLQLPSSRISQLYSVKVDGQVRSVVHNYQFSVWLSALLIRPHI